MAIQSKIDQKKTKTQCLILLSTNDSVTSYIYVPSGLKVFKSGQVKRRMMNWKRGSGYMRGKQWWRRASERREGTGEVEMSRGRRRLMENGEGAAVRKEVASRNCQSAGILPSHQGGGMCHASTK